MSTGNATGSSGGSNKRVRYADKATVVDPTRGAPISILVQHNAQFTPMKRAETTINHGLESLHYELHASLKKYAQKSILAFATHFRAQEKFARDVSNNNYLPTD